MRTLSRVYAVPEGPRQAPPGSGLSRRSNGRSPFCCSGVSALVLVLLFTPSALADVRLHSLFTDNMVLQQGVPVPIWGWADEGEEVTVQFRDQKVKARAMNGKWMARLSRLKAGGPDIIQVTGKNGIVLRNVMVGEVWICSGQSNMEWRLSAAEPEATSASVACPAIRLFTVEKTKADQPLEDVKGSWQECARETAAGFSAVGYFFGRDLQKALNVPIGLIHTSWGGSPAEVWMSEAALRANPSYESILDSYLEASRRFEAEKTQYDQEKERADKEGKVVERRLPRAPWKPTELYNGMISPLIPFAFKGAIWYQGESNASRARQYRTLFPDMIRNWRADWRQADFPFLLVQLAPYDKVRKRTLEEITASPVDSDWAELREAQFLATRSLPNVGMAVITDIGEKDDIHPARKGPVGARLALAARALAYGEKIVHCGPVLKKLTVKGNQAVLTFDHVGKGLEARGGDLTGFAICGEDRKFVWGRAQIKGNQVVVSSPEVSRPVAVRYGWADFPVVNLWNQDGLPAFPFRTDDFPMITN